MPIRLSESQSQLVGAIVAAIFGLGLFVVGGRLVIYEYMLAEPVQVSGSIIDSGQTRSSRGGNINFIRYEFIDQHGKTQIGTSSGYSGKNGGNILVEYCPHFPSIHRVAGEGNTSGYEWRWPITGFGLFFLFVGIHWWWSIWESRRRPIEPKY
jgi:hypothetical protein